jgi:hypothetical protein
MSGNSKSQSELVEWSNPREYGWLHSILILCIMLTHQEDMKSLRPSMGTWQQNEMAGPDPATNSPAGMADISPTKQPVNWLARRR